MAHNLSTLDYPPRRAIHHRQRRSVRIAADHEFAELECFDPNTPAIEFYRRRGYTIERTYFVEDAGVNTAVMVKKLDR